MRLIADECCDSAIAQAFLAAGHEVLRIAEIMPGATDEEVARFALKEKGILLTEDKDFGQLVHAAGQQAIGVLFFRFPCYFRKQIAADAVRFVEKRGEALHGSFVVIQLGKIRITRPFSE